VGQRRHLPDNLHRTAPHRTAPHRTAPHRTAPHLFKPFDSNSKRCAMLRQRMQHYGADAVTVMERDFLTVDPTGG
jgi:hypothetical protein